MSEEESRHAKMPPGWKRVSLQIPIPLSKIWTAEAEAKGVSSIKVMGTAMMALFLGMPEDVRNALFLQVSQMTWKNRLDVDPDAVWKTLRAMVEAHEGGEPLARVWQMDRLLDPEVTPARGQKASDRTAAHRSAHRKGA